MRSEPLRGSSQRELGLPTEGGLVITPRPHILVIAVDMGWFRLRPATKTVIRRGLVGHRELVLPQCDEIV
jgi:hypothetical protein